MEGPGKDSLCQTNDVWQGGMTGVRYWYKSKSVARTELERQSAIKQVLIDTRLVRLEEWLTGFE